jgi:hypothetical protein
VSSVVHLHIGVPKTGTTYLQAMLYRNRGLLRRNGVLYPGFRSDAHFLATRDLQGADRPYGDALERQAGAWDRVARAVRRFDGVAVISHELLARSKPEQIRRAVGSFGDAEVRVVITARDLGRQVPAIWQENVKNRRVATYEDYLQESFRSDLGRRRRRGYWWSQNLVLIARRWADVVGHDSVTFVTVPPPGAPAGELWDRFRLAAGLPDLPYGAPASRENRSLRADESELLRRLNLHLDDLSWEDYITVVKYHLAQDLMVGLSDGPGICIPDEYHAEVEEASRVLVRRLRRAGYPVVGDLADLRPRLISGATPEQVPDSRLLELSLDLVAELTTRAPLSPVAALREAPHSARRLVAESVQALRTWR